MSCSHPVTLGHGEILSRVTQTGGDIVKCVSTLISCYLERKHCHCWDLDFCEAQGKGRAKGQPRKVTQRSFIDGGWWISFP